MFSLYFSTYLTITGTPRLILNIGGTTKHASYSSGSGTSAIVFDYTVESGLTGADGITVGASIDLNTSETLTDAVGNSINTTLNSIGSTTAVNVDTTAPTANFGSATDDVLILQDTTYIADHPKSS